MPDLLVATRSAGKMREIRRILGGVEAWRILDLDEAGIAYHPSEEDLEPYATFEMNAQSKALHFSEQSGLITVADDSGIVIDALGGAPGVRSKRFAPDEGLEGQARDDANNRYMVHLLRHTPPEERTAHYVCVAVFVEPGYAPVMIRAEAHGSVVDEPRGDDGFGYDPYFFDPEMGRTFAELTPEEKDHRSHRGRAFRQLRATLEQWTPETPAGG